MAITQAQRVTAVEVLLSALNSGPEQFAAMTGGQTPNQLIANIVTAMGTQFDPILTAALAFVARIQAQRIAQLQAQVATAQAQVTAYTVV